MKNKLNLFYTLPAKAALSVIFFVLSIVIADCQVEYFALYKQDNESFVNAIAQVDAFDYETSHYYKNTVRGTVENVTLMCMNYSGIFSGESTAEEILSHYSSIGDTGFLRAYDFLSGCRGLHFAVVNHDRKKIYSDIADINGLSSSTDIRRYFGKADRNLLIARSCRNPCFATVTFIDFAEDIRRCAEKYDEDFDLYISFGDEAVYAENEARYEKLHFEMREKIEKLNDKIISYSLLLLFVGTMLMTVTGKREMNGKTYGTVMNRLPNDMLLFMYGTVLLCLSSLYRTSLDMLLTHGGELGAFWFARSEEFYTNRIKLCIVIFFCAGLNLLCILKRQYKMGMLFRNTYLYHFVENLKRFKKGGQTPEKAEK